MWGLSNLALATSDGSQRMVLKQECGKDVAWLLWGSFFFFCMLPCLQSKKHFYQNQMLVSCLQCENTLLSRVNVQNFFCVVQRAVQALCLGGNNVCHMFDMRSHKDTGKAFQVLPSKCDRNVSRRTYKDIRGTLVHISHLKVQYGLNKEERE